MNSGGDTSKIKLYPLEKTAKPYSCHYTGITRLVKRREGKKGDFFKAGRFVLFLCFQV